MNMPPTKMILHTKSEKTLEVTVDEARELWEELNKVFGLLANPGIQWPYQPVTPPTWVPSAPMWYYDPNKWTSGDPPPSWPGSTCIRTADGTSNRDLSLAIHSLL